jgi:hypothetical protein
MQMSSACEAPIHASLNSQDQGHPLYSEYLRYRSAMSQQLVTCNSFKNWLAQREESEIIEQALAHPRHFEYCQWLRECVNCDKPVETYVSFWEWLNKA